VASSRWVRERPIVAETFSVDVFRYRSRFGALTFIHDDLVGSSLELSVTVSSWCGDSAPHTLMTGICSVVDMLSRRPAGHDSDVGVLRLIAKSVRRTYESMNAARLPGWTLCSKYSRYTLARS